MKLSRLHIPLKITKTFRLLKTHSSFQIQIIRFIEKDSRNSTYITRTFCCRCCWWYPPCCCRMCAGRWQSKDRHISRVPRRTDIGALAIFVELAVFTGTSFYAGVFTLAILQTSVHVSAGGVADRKAGLVKQTSVAHYSCNRRKDN